MPEAAMVMPKGPSGAKNNGGAYVDRDKPAQIRFSNISAGKGEVYFLVFTSRFVCLFVTEMSA